MTALISHSFRAFLFIMVFIQATAFAEEAGKKPRCDKNAVTRNCSFFQERENQFQIELSDGTSFRNPMYKSGKTPITPTKNAEEAPLSLSAKGAYGMGVMDPAALQIYLQNQAEILDLFDGTDASNEFKLSFTSAIPMVASNPESEIKIPWPLNVKKAPLSSHSGKEVLAAVEKMIGQEKTKNLRTLLDRKKTEFQKFTEAQQSAQKQAQLLMVQEQERKAQEKAKFEKRRTHVEQLFREAQDKVLQTLSRSGLSPQDLKSFQDRIERLTLKEISLSDPSSTCANLAENAFYDPLSSQVTLCPSLLFSPDAALLTLFGHEIGHSIDPCRAQMDTWEINPKGLDEFLKNQSLPEEDKATLQEFQTRGSKFVDYDLSLILSSKTLETITQQKVLQKIQSGVSATQVPFRKEYLCFVQKNHFREISAKDAQDTVKYLIQRSQEAPPDKRKIFVEHVNNYKKMMRKYPQCLKSATHSSQMGEVMGDMLGSIVVSGHLQKDPPKNEEEAVGSVMFISHICPTTDPQTTMIGFQGVFGALADKHPNLPMRFEKVILNQPRFAEIFHCKRTEKSCYEHLLNQTASSSKTIPAGGTQ